MEKELIKLVIDYGATVAFFIAAIILLYKYFDQKIKCGSDGIAIFGARNPNNKSAVIQTMSKEDLLGHEYFSRMRVYMVSVIPYLELDSAQKQKCLINFLLIKFGVFADALEQFCKTDLAHNPCYRSCEWLSAIQTVLINSVNEYEERARKSGIPDIFIEHFNDIHSARVRETLDLMASMGRSPFLPNNAMRTYLTMDLMIAIFNATLTDAVHAINELNGELEEQLKNY